MASPMTSPVETSKSTGSYVSQTDYFSPMRRLAMTSDNDIPAEFPKSIISPSTWSKQDFTNGSRETPTFTLEKVHIKEIEQALKDFLDLKLALERVSQKTFILPTLGKELKNFATKLTDGIGFFIIRGLDSQCYSNKENVVLYLGISSYIGEKRGRQDELGNMLLHLTDLGQELAPENQRQAPYSSVGQPFHTDVGDIIALYALGEASVGGENNLVSSAAVYNEIANTRPDIIRLLSSSTWVFDSFGLFPAYTNRPLLYPISQEKILLAFARRPLVGHTWSPRTSGIPTLSSSQIEALDTIQSVADKHAISLKLKRGEMLFWNNLALMHSRNGFTDGPDSRRHLLRLWLRNGETESKWPIPRELKSMWEDAFEHNERPQLWPVEVIKDREYITNQQRASGHD